jgi:hypothetical protein
VIGAEVTASASVNVHTFGLNISSRQWVAFSQSMAADKILFIALTLRNHYYKTFLP